MDVQSLFGVPSGTVAVVTGGGRGLGRMIASAYVANGATVYISSRSASTIDGTAKELTDAGPGKCIAIAADLSQYDECVRLAEEIERQSGGVSYAAPLDEYPDQAWTDLMTLNVQRVFTLTQKLAPLLERSQSSGQTASVINIGTVYAVGISPPESYAYSASKAALHHLTRRLSYTLGPRGITVNALCLGPFRTELLAATLEEGEEAIAKRLPMRRIGEASDISAACLWLSSRGGSWVTGTIIPIDGGSLATPNTAL